MPKVGTHHWCVFRSSLLWMPFWQCRAADSDEPSRASLCAPGNSRCQPPTSLDSSVPSILGSVRWVCVCVGRREGGRGVPLPLRSKPITQYLKEGCVCNDANSSSLETVGLLKVKHTFRQLS